MAAAQQSTDPSEQPDGKAAPNADPCAAFDPEAVREALEGKVPAREEAPDVSGAGAPAREPLSEACLEYLEVQRKADEARRAEQPAPTDDEEADSQPTDDDFKPDEEISEDYPVPLPSDI